MKKYMKIISSIERNILEGHLCSGQKLQSVREAAKHYECSNSTVIQAYNELEKQHLIYAIPQSGFYVVERTFATSDTVQSKIIDLTSPSPDVNVFPYLDFQHCLNKAIDTYKYQLFTYGDSYGLQKLRQTLISHLASSQVFAKLDQIIITAGVQQALDILASMPFPNENEVILVEQPSYDIYLRYLELKKLPVWGIARTASGIDLEELESLFKSGKIKFFYTMSRHHNPLGTSYNTKERKTIAELASKYNVYIVEDDYMADLGDDPRFDPIFAYNQTSHVIYLKSFSKIIFPGLRLGAAVLPEKLIKSFQSFNRYGEASLLSQAALEVYIKNGMYERHKHKIQLQYTTRMQALNDAVQRFNDEGRIEIAGVQSGVFIQLKLPQTILLERLTERLAKRQIKVVPGDKFYVAGFLEREKFLRLSISRAQSDQIDEGIKTIIEEVGRGNRWS